METLDTLLDTPSDRPAVDARPALPQPTLARWQPLRLGLVELFHYDSEEFWFRDGHLLLRGNNGTGKSKVLSLTLPFLFDAQLKPSRIEPDGDAGKKMAWNLLLGKLDRRIGYAWIEFGRIADDGAPDYLTLGCGLSAVAARAQVDAWFFVLEGRRIGEDLWLTSPARNVLTRERLKEALHEHGQVFDTAAAYRRAVDERLFQLGAVRYAALMDTLVQLRQPQLSKKPDESKLSDALTEALPPLSAELLTDVADALNQLEEYRRELQDYEALAKAVGQFTQRYQRYAVTNDWTKPKRPPPAAAPPTPRSRPKAAASSRPGSSTSRTCRCCRWLSRRCPRWPRGSPTCKATTRPVWPCRPPNSAPPTTWRSSAPRSSLRRRP